MKPGRMYRSLMRKSIWCEGCGLGNLQQILIQSVVDHVSERLGVDSSTNAGIEKIKNNIAMVSGIGCTSRMPGHMDVNSLHTTHGRSLGFATGLKMANPELTVVVAAGDGDIFAIGGNHFIHAARRNPNMTLIVYDNQSYGMTGSQHSPTSPLGQMGTSVPFGVFEAPFNLVNLALGAGTSFVAQGAITTNQEHQDQLEEMIRAALNYKGFSFVNVRGTCHTGWGKYNGLAEAYRYRQDIESKVVPVERWRELSPAEQQGKIPVGIIHQDDRPDIQSSSSYLQAVKKSQSFQASKKEALETITLQDNDPLANLKRTSIRFAGTGGQGVITAGEIALQVALQSNFNGVYTKNYGPEARGGEAFSDVIISQGEVYFPQTDKLDILLALNQETFDKFRDVVAENGKIIVNSTQVTETYSDPRVILSPIGELLSSQVRPPKRDLGINVLALAVTLAYLDLLPQKVIETVVMQGVGRKNPVLNQKALDVGFQEAARLKR
ncbi:thiamine pyrophosphate-dependent enzyme [Deltaproteobacteria bacterium TL4]